MLTDGNKYVVELFCGYPEWWRFNIYMMIVSCDKEGNSLSFRNYTDRIYDVEYGTGRGGPEGFDPAGRIATIESDPCHHIEVYAYAVTNTFPDSESIKDSPPFQAILTVKVDGEQISTRRYDVNQWGGLTISGQRFGLEQ
ncbi:MAG: hypothetical protein LIO77_02580 [Rikenellaceae bacterium]|nr:hypothetical protein [Rikenellaceae bacterium]